MCKQFIRRDFTNKEAILQILPSFKPIAMVKLVIRTNKSSLATFSGMPGTSLHSVPLKRRVPRRRKTQKRRRRPISSPRRKRTKKRGKQRKGRNVRKPTTLTMVTMVMLMAITMAKERVIIITKRTLLTSIIISRRRERDGQWGRISRLILLNLGVETVDVNNNNSQAHHQTLN